MNRFRYLNTSTSCPRSLLCTRLMNQVPGFAGGSCCFWYQESSLLLFSSCIFSILSMSRLKCGNQNWTACSKCGWTRDLYNGRISSFFLYLKLRAINPSTLLAVLQLFSFFFLGLFEGEQAYLRRPCAWYCFECLSENWYFEVGEACLCGYLCVTSLILCICFPNHWVLFTGVGVRRGPGVRRWK